MVQIKKKNPVTIARELAVAAYGASSNRKPYFRVMQRILDLAKARGYKHSEDFVAYFSKKSKYTASATNRMLRKLFEFVSADEIEQLSGLLKTAN